MLFNLSGGFRTHNHTDLCSSIPTCHTSFFSSKRPHLSSSCCQFCRLFVSTVEQCEAAVLERLQSNAKLKRQNFGSQSYIPPKSSAAATVQTTAAPSDQPSEIPADPDATLRKAAAGNFFTIIIISGTTRF